VTGPSVDVALLPCECDAIDEPGTETAQAAQRSARGAIQYPTIVVP
jgi:hypothetical protein